MLRKILDFLHTAVATVAGFAIFVFCVSLLLYILDTAMRGLML